MTTHPPILALPSLRSGRPPSHRPYPPRGRPPAHPEAGHAAEGCGPAAAYHPVLRSSVIVPNPRPPQKHLISAARPRSGVPAAWTPTAASPPLLPGRPPSHPEAGHVAGSCGPATPIHRASAPPSPCPIHTRPKSIWSPSAHPRFAEPKKRTPTASPPLLLCGSHPPAWPPLRPAPELRRAAVEGRPPIRPPSPPSRERGTKPSKPGRRSRRRRLRPCRRPPTRASAPPPACPIPRPAPKVPGAPVPGRSTSQERRDSNTC